MPSGASAEENIKRDEEELEDIFADAFEFEINQIEFEFEQLLHMLGDSKAFWAEFYSTDRFRTL
eukprot:4886573-Karenia_brevis.AAC.1